MQNEIWKELLNDDKIRNEYNKIDEVNQYAFNHGLKHIQNVCNIMNKLCELLKIIGNEKEALLIACVFHDIGQTESRENHGLKAKEYVINNYNDLIKKHKFYNAILDSVESHDDNELDETLSLFQKMVQFADKMDFTRERLEENYKSKFGYRIYENIKDVDFIYNDVVFGINIVSDKKTEDVYEKFISGKFSKKVINITIALAHKLNRIPMLCVDGKEKQIAELLYL